MHDEANPVVRGGATWDRTPTPDAPSVVDRRGNHADRATQDDERRREVSASRDAVEAALARAIEAEVDERKPGWEARVALLAGELRARRLVLAGRSAVPLERKGRERA
jgi:hypothetical protein